MSSDLRAGVAGGEAQDPVPSPSSRRPPGRRARLTRPPPSARNVETMSRMRARIRMERQEWSCR